MLLLGLRPFDQAEEELGEVADDDEGWGQCWTAVVFHNQVVSLELPEDVCVALHYLKCVAANGKKKRTKSHWLNSFSQTDTQMDICVFFYGFPAPDLNMAMSRLSSRTLVTRRKITSSRMTSQLA